jgi:hypothetical protein
MSVVLMALAFGGFCYCLFNLNLRGILIATIALLLTLIFVVAVLCITLFVRDKSTFRKS